jgi:adenosylhomocysteine nucleosidase
MSRQPAAAALAAPSLQPPPPEAAPPTAGLTLVVTPLAAEMAGVIAATGDLSRRRRAPRRGGDGSAGAAGLTAGRPRPARLRRPRRAVWRTGVLAGQPVVLGTTGDGAAAAAAGLAALIAAVRPGRVLVLGVAGGLTPGLAEGSLVAARQVVDAGGAAAPLAAEPGWLELAVACGATAGTVVSTPGIVCGPAAKSAARRRALASTAGGDGAPGAAAALAAAKPTAPTAPTARMAEPMAVDLESWTYAKVAAAHSLPLLVVRAVLDPAEEALPLDFERCRTPDGGVSTARVLLAALARPRSLPVLWRLHGRMSTAAARLAALARCLLAAAGPSAGVVRGSGAAVTGPPETASAAGAESGPVDSAGRPGAARTWPRDTSSPGAAAGRPDGGGSADSAGARPGTGESPPGAAQNRMLSSENRRRRAVAASRRTA